MTNKTNRTTLEDVGQPLVANGYSIVPIRKGEKRPFMAKWQDLRSTKGDLNRWLNDGHEECGAGILTFGTPAVDIDCLDEDVSAEMIAWIEDEFFIQPPRRYGKRPKSLLLFRTEHNFRKLKSGVWEDPMFGETHAVEILGDGQQFVAFGIHKDTRQPYQWENGDPTTIPVDELPLLTEEMAQQIIDKFDEIAAREGWEKKSDRVLQRATYGGEADPDDDDSWDRDVLMPPLEVETDELRAILLAIPNNEAHYDTWCNIGMALYHQYGGDEKGFELWCEWAEQSDKHDLKTARFKWKSFDHHGKRSTPVTARTIYKLARDAAKDASEKMLLEFTTDFLEASSPEEWNDVVRRVRESELEQVQRRQLENVARTQHQAVTRLAEIRRGVPDDKAKGITITAAEVRKQLSYKPSRDKMPWWMEGWVYDDSKDVYVNLKTKIEVSEKGFNANYDRFIQQVNESYGASFSSGSEAALKYFNLKVVQGVRYEPGAGDIFIDAGRSFANSYREDIIPAIPTVVQPRDKIAVNRVKNHIKHLLPEEKEARMFLDWMAYVVQNPGMRVNYAVVLQGTQGDGKSFFRCLMETVMGLQNVRVMKAKSLESDFNSWAIGQCVTAIEEIRLSGHNRYEILNNLKDQVTNNHIEVHAKGMNQYVAKNTTNYLLFTNFKDALPIDDNDRRYLVLQSRWQSRDMLDEFEQANEDYYEKLYESLEMSPGGLRKWLVEDHVVSDIFNPKGKAPITIARQEMIKTSKPEFTQAVEDIVLQKFAPGVNADFIVGSHLREAMMEYEDIEMPKTKAQSAMLMKMGYSVVERMKIDNRSERVYVKPGSEFVEDGGINLKAVRAVLDKSMVPEPADFSEEL